MKVRRTSREEMRSRTARFGELRPRQQRYDSEHGIPLAAYEELAAKKIFLLMAPPGAGGASHHPAVQGAPGLVVSICECPPGNGPELHAHALTVETFLCLSGRFEVRWGEAIDERLVLEPLDMVCVPPNVMRAFRNVSSETARLLVMIQGDNQALNDVAFTPAVAERISQRYGEPVLQAFKSTVGMRFDAEIV